MRRAGRNAFDQQAGERWQRLWSHREELLKVARRRSVSVEDAEDAVHEAMLRSAEHAHVEDERLGAWLTTASGPGGGIGGGSRGLTAAPQVPVAQVSVPALPADGLPTVPAASLAPQVPALTRATAVPVPPVSAPVPPMLPVRPAVHVSGTGAPGCPRRALSSLE